MIYKTIIYNDTSYFISGLTSDSRMVKTGMAFLAVRGTVMNGTDFIYDAIENGAQVIITHMDIQDSLSDIPNTIQVIYCKNPRRVYAQMCNVFYMPKPRYIMMVTGTNGKTSVANFATQLLQKCGKSAISVGTMGVQGAIQDDSISLTTPEPADLHRILYDAHTQHNVEYACLEASSHGLNMCRLDGLSVQVGAFTNLSHDHLDYHGNMASYFKAKSRLFSHVLPPQSTAVLNAGTKEFCHLQHICLARDIRVISYGVVGKKMVGVPDIHVYALSTTETGFYVHMTIMKQRICTHIPLIGAFQLENVLCALGLVLQNGLNISDIMPHLSHITPVCGRMQFVVKTPLGADIYLDYAHTPNALQTALQALREHTQNRLIIVFGCGGNRDNDKRPKMGKIACDYADAVFVTDDNPRHENPATIRKQIIKGNRMKCVDAGNRIDAIAHALHTAEQGDIVLVAGKGHETGQIIGDTIYPHSDVQTITQIIQDMRT